MQGRQEIAAHSARTAHGACGLAIFLACLLLAFTPAAAALKSIDITNDAEIPAANLDTRAPAAWRPWHAYAEQHLRLAANAA